MRLDFPKIDNDIELKTKDFAETRTLLRKFVHKVYMTERNVNIYSNGHRLYIFKTKWKRVPVYILTEWASAVSESFREWLGRKKTFVCGLNHGIEKWSRIEKLYSKQQLKYYAKQKKRDRNFDAVAILREVSSKNASLRVRRSN